MLLILTPSNTQTKLRVLLSRCCGANHPQNLYNHIQQLSHSNPIEILPNDLLFQIDFCCLKICKIINKASVHASCRFCACDGASRESFCPIRIWGKTQNLQWQCEMFWIALQHNVQHLQFWRKTSSIVSVFSFILRLSLRVQSNFGFFHLFFGKTTNFIFTDSGKLIPSINSNWNRIQWWWHWQATHSIFVRYFTKIDAWTAPKIVSSIMHQILNIFAALMFLNALSFAFF